MTPEDDCVRLDSSPCPQCGYFTDAASATNKNEENHMPSDGDIAICFSCANFNIYNENLKLRLPTVEEYLAIKDDAPIVLAQEAIRRLRGIL